MSDKIVGGDGVWLQGDSNDGVGWDAKLAGWDAQHRACRRRLAEATDTINALLYDLRQMDYVNSDQAEEIAALRYRVLVMEAEKLLRKNAVFDGSMVLFGAAVLGFLLVWLWVWGG